MKINQRYHNSEQQKLFNSKLYEKYKNHMDYLIQDTQQLSFNSIQTPGWTSLVATQQSKQTKNVHHKKIYDSIPSQNNQENGHSQILNRLNSLPKLNHNQEIYSNIRLNPNSSLKNKNIIIYDSAKMSQKKINQTPRTGVNRFLNRFSSSKNIGNPNNNQFKNVKRFMSVEKNHSKQKFNSKKNSPATKQRISSVRSQPNMNLKQLIHQRLTLATNSKLNNQQNFNYFNNPSQFQSKLNTQENQIKENFLNTVSQKNNQLLNPPKFYSKIHNPYAKNNNMPQKNQYLNKYLHKLHQRSQSATSFKHKKQGQSKNLDPQRNRAASTNNIKKQSRFNAISIHDHLYHGSVKLQAKKTMARMIDESYKKSTVLTFTPQISQKSHILAQSKFLRQSKLTSKQQRNKQNLNFQQNQIPANSLHNFHKNCVNKSSINNKLQYGTNHASKFQYKVTPIQQKITLKQKQKMLQKIQNRTLIKLYNILSLNSQKITQKTIQQNIQKLPLSLIQLLQPLLTKIYQKNSYTWQQFISLFTSDKDKQNFSSINKETNNKSNINLSSKKSTIMIQTERYLKQLNISKKNQNKHENEHEQKENVNFINSNFNNSIKKYNQYQTQQNNHNLQSYLLKKLKIHS